MIDPSQARHFYRAALLGLHHLDSRERTSRRFGPDADARWNSFRGHLRTAERIDLLLRDAAVKWKTAFSPAEVFLLPGLASDEPFGPDWQSLPEHEARDLWQAEPPEDGLSACADALGLRTQDVEVPEITGSTRLVVAGASSVVGVAAAFAVKPDFSWSDQVIVIAETPGSRQLAGLAAPLLNAKSATRVLAPRGEPAAALTDAGFSAGWVPVVSADATRSEREFVHEARSAH